MRRTVLVFFPFDLFGSAGAASGADLLAEAIAEMIEDNRRERKPTRARAYRDQIRTHHFNFDTLTDLQKWRSQGRAEVRRILARGDFLGWIAGNHLGVLPVYEELPTDTLVLQFDAHLDIYNLSDCTAQLSHGNFLLHADSPLPQLVNIGHRELLLPPRHVNKYYHATFSAAELAIDPAPALEQVRKLAQSAKRVFLDIDCDVFDPAYFPAVSHPLPLGLSPALLLRFADAAWSQSLVGMAISEFDPSRDHRDRSLSTLIWLLEFFLLRRYEGKPMSL